jgi:mRNA interferase RelE/StbE
MAKPAPYEIRVSRAAVRQLRKLDGATRGRVDKALLRQAAAAGSGRGARGGKAVKAIQGRQDRFLRLRVGDHRVMYDLRDEDRIVLVLGIVHRRDLDRWLKNQ